MDTKLHKNKKKTSEQKSRQQKFAINNNVVLLEAFGSVNKITSFNYLSEILNFSIIN